MVERINLFIVTFSLGNYCYLVLFFIGMGKCGQVLEICINIEICDLNMMSFC